MTSFILPLLGPNFRLYL